MAQKNFTTAPKPTKQSMDEEIDAFERDGPGHDTATRHTGKPTAAQKAKADPIKRLSLDLPQSLHTRFKTACSATRRKMGNELRAFIAARTEELEKEAGVVHK